MQRKSTTRQYIQRVEHKHVEYILEVRMTAIGQIHTNDVF